VREFLQQSPFVLTNPHTYIATLKNPTFIQPFFNFLLTLPFGVYLRVLYKTSWKKTLLFSFLLTLSFECIQRSA
jgi:glycopeptide antibiotics resistance protein